MSCEREPLLPDGLGDILDRIQQQEQTDQVYAKVEGDLLSYATKLAPIVFIRLYRKIDHDLLYTTEDDLVRPEIREASYNLLREVSPSFARDKKLSSWVVDLMTHETWSYICTHRPMQK